MNDRDERMYIKGEQAVYRRLLVECLTRLPHHERDKEKYNVERTDVIFYLRSVCEEHGDNEWPDDLHIVDILDKHLLCYFGKGV